MRKTRCIANVSLLVSFCLIVSLIVVVFFYCTKEKREAHGDKWLLDHCIDSVSVDEHDLENIAVRCREAIDAYQP